MSTKFLDLEGLKLFWSKVKGYTDGIVGGKVDKTTTINGQSLGGNVTLGGPNIIVGGSGTYKGSTVQAAVDSLDAAVKAASSKAGVTSFGGKTGAVTVKTSAGNGGVNFTMVGNELQGTVVGLGSAAYTNSADYAKTSHTHSVSQITDKQGLVIKVNSGSTEGTSQYTYNVTTAKSLDIKAGSNITLTPAVGSLTISAANTTYSPATPSSNGLMSSADKSKLDGIETGAQVNKVISVAGKTGAVTITKSDVGLSEVTNESKTTMFNNAALTGVPTAPTAGTSTNNTQIATTAFVQSVVDSKIAASDAMIYKGTIGSSGATVTALPTTHKTGWTYKVITAGTYAGQRCEVGDMIIALIDRSGSGNTNSDWSVVQTNVDGAVTGPASSVENHIVTFGGSTGKIIKDSGFTIATSVPPNAKFTDTVYTHPVTPGYKHIPSGGSSGQILRWSADGTAVWGPEYNTTYGQANSSTLGLVKIGYEANGKNYPVTLNASGQMYVSVPWTDTNTTYGLATSSSNGLMSSTDKAKLDGIGAGAKPITIDSSLSSSSTNPVQNKIITSALGGKAISRELSSAEDLNNIKNPGFYNAAGGNGIKNKPSGVDYFGLEIIHAAGGDLYFQKLYDPQSAKQYTRTLSNAVWSSWKEDKLTDTTYTLGSFGITASSTELNCCVGVTSSIQTQLNGKAPSSHTHPWSQITGAPISSAITTSEIETMFKA